MLDSSPVALPPLPRPLKRSASTASLPTPPRTHHKRKHASGRGCGAYDTDTDHEGLASENDKTVVAPKGHRHKHKKRKTETGVAADAEEEAFWLSKSDGDVPAPASTFTSHKQPSPAPALLYRRRLVGAASSSSVGMAPVSPPPSNRKTAVASPPVTPQPKRVFPMRDSPNNPFLVSPSSAAAADDSASPSPSPNPSPHTPAQERPTVTYVFRGVRGTFPNPLYDHERGRPRSPSARAKLPIEHPDFSPDPHCPPKALFPPAAPRKQRQSARVAMRDGAKGRARHRTLEEEMHATSGYLGKRGRSISGSDSEEEEKKDDEERIMPMKLEFKAPADPEEDG